MEMNTALMPYSLSAAGSSAIGTSNAEGNGARAFSLAPAAQNIAFYFRNWPFPVDATEQLWDDTEMRSWQEKLASYREASLIRRTEKAQTEEPKPAEARPAEPGARNGAAPPLGPDASQDDALRVVTAPKPAAAESQPAPDRSEPAMISPEQAADTPPADTEQGA
ncbi:hypothetical protein SAMN04489859_102312 [Paracoccus alcaliphilus]|uniref:Uncharacterized protein n=1 Tax=Paracoccus alcaliphilus TaxID=34002 RepID=A0A1H8KLS0_9RHOB|nr:hypothetical protein [Paracoccus alcaliphilus]WCR17330.1 hypothetical protein JHW40_13400 [Paracoccus alcaliphilus]SEN93899.1 hypothetical protein SAMN04489859_102312 [Paracoccus alcaliphilus]